MPFTTRVIITPPLIWSYKYEKLWEKRGFFEKGSIRNYEEKKRENVKRAVVARVGDFIEKGCLVKSLC